MHVNPVFAVPNETLNYRESGPVISFAIYNAKFLLYMAPLNKSVKKCLITKQ